MFWIAWGPDTELPLKSHTAVGHMPACVYQPDSSTCSVSQRRLIFEAGLLIGGRQHFLNRQNTKTTWPDAQSQHHYKSYFQLCNCLTFVKSAERRRALPLGAPARAKGASSE